jgi:GDP-mannose 6-dehydrogenase
MRVAIFGLGYVGAVSTACLAECGHHVVGVDLNQLKVDLVKSGRSPIIEERIADLLLAGIESGRIKATTRGAEAVAETDLSLVCVGTPSRENGSLDTAAIDRTMESIGEGLRHCAHYHVVVLRSTSLPGTANKVCAALERISGKRCGEDFGVCVNPEFLREGSAVADFYSPPFTIIGEDNSEAGDLVAALYAKVDAPIHRVPLGAAEMIKYASNAFHAVKVSFANEIGSICRAQGIDGRQVMDLMSRDNKLNISRAYLRPGFAFGGSCLPKDLRAIVYKANRLDLDTPLLNSILHSNAATLRAGIRRILRSDAQHIALLGLAFKAGTDDLRESPMMQVAESLIGKGRQLRIYDRNVQLARLVGANKAYLDHKIPHISSLLVDSLEEAIEFGEILVLGGSGPELADLPHLLQVYGVRPVIDLAGAFPENYFATADPVLSVS